MRLDDFDPNINVEDQRGQGGGGFGGFGGGGGGLLLGLLPMVFGRFGCAGVAIVLVLMVVFGGGLLLGLLPMVFGRFGCAGVAIVLVLMVVFGGGLSGLGSLMQMGGPVGQAPQSSGPRSAAKAGGGTSAQQACAVDASSRAACNAFSSADKTWAAIFAQSGQRFQQPKLVFFGGQGQSGCGAAQSAMGPFYCPSDQGIYLDTSFFSELQNRFRASGDFAQDYVIAHEFGHHIQNLLGTSDQVQRAQRQASETEGNALSVKLELQADCFAGVWAAANRARIEPGDIEEGMTAARAIGDDTLQREAQGRVVPDSFTHGSAAQRQQWLKRGLDSGDPAQCDTFGRGA